MLCICCCKCNELCTSITESRISGAEEPSAMSVRLDTVSFQIRTVATVVSPLGLVTVTTFSCSHRSLGKCSKCLISVKTYLKCPNTSGWKSRLRSGTKNSCFSNFKMLLCCVKCKLQSQVLSLLRSILNKLCHRQESSTDFCPYPLCTCINLFMILGTIDDGYSKPSQFYVEQYSTDWQTFI